MTCLSTFRELGCFIHEDAEFFVKCPFEARCARDHGSDLRAEQEQRPSVFTAKSLSVIAGS